jgi:uncharacterized membrane protein
MTATLPAWRIAAVVALLSGYALLSHALMVHAAPAPYTVALLFGPLLVAIGAVGWRQRQWITLAACAALLLVLAVVVWRGHTLNAQRLYVLQHGAIHLALAWGFALTLRHGHKALITLLAEGVHGKLGQTFTPEMAHYTRTLTQLWATYFVLMVAVSALVYWRASWEWWSFYCTVFTPLAAVGLFVGEHLWRCWAHPEFPRVSMRAAFEAYQRHNARGAAR